MTGKRSFNTNLNVNKENNDTLNSLLVVADMFNEALVSFATTVEGPTTQEPKDCFKNDENNEDKMCVFRTNVTEVFNLVGTLQNKKAVGNDGVSGDCVKLRFWFSYLF